MLFAILGFAWLRWISVWVSFDSEKMILRKGLYISSEDTVFYSNISTLSITQNFLYRLLGASTVYIGTNSGKADQADLKMILRRSDADRLYEELKGSRKKSLNYSILPNKLRLIVFSLFFSSALSGVLIILALLLEIGKIVDREVEARLILDTLNEAARRVSLYVPPIITVIVIVIISAWALSFISNLFVFWGFVLTKCSDSIYIKSGVVTKNRHILLRDRINYIDLKQSFLSKVFNVSSLHLNCSGYGSAGRNELSVVLPITTRKEINGAIEEVFPEYPRPKIELKSNPRSYLSFFMMPLIFAAVPAAAFGAFYVFLPTWFEAAKPAFAISMIPALWLALCRALSMFTTGLGFSGDFMTLRYSKLFTFHTVIVPKERLTQIVIRQSPFQRMSGGCSAIIYTSSESRARHLILGLRMDRLLAMLEREGYDLYFREGK